jgi:hypothetical protein
MADEEGTMSLAKPGVPFLHCTNRYNVTAYFGFKCDETGSGALSFEIMLPNHPREFGSLFFRAGFEPDDRIVDMNIGCTHPVNTGIKQRDSHN